MREFCRISLEFIRKGSNPRVYQTAARKFTGLGDHSLEFERESDCI